MYVQTHIHNRPCDGVLAAPSGLAADNIKRLKEQRFTRHSPFHFVDGQSCKQGNGFDCGVFAMLNANRFVRNMDNKRFAQMTMSFVRIMLISLYETYSLLLWPQSQYKISTGRK